ncbi:transcriptional regulator, ArsR family [Caldanaerovirga acetigignens]|uniref:Transcriptional regulator, ArsR family n=1 Tax=Caldanaerovirga acetigignens TaxID=447595 RepID=A0A1M7KLD9_9FIRM|nr:metalloregulator ArsR/SmtB family transcription factor [Caldanaerovirga acetigignens]MCF6096068.1 metalloregulator ArsR/SmtB family transcription factor [Thermovorax subterraneus]SHM66258.1 transcriptional regulator, ArsR family [Caldanaerovirga acetigignens]
MSDEIYDMYASIFKALSHPTRIKIIELLATKGEMCVCNISENLKIDQPTVSKHLSILKNAGIIESKKEGLMVNYKIRMPCIVDFFRCANQVIQADINAKFALSLKKIEVMKEEK